MASTIHPKLFYTSVLGNIIEHYDKVLFGLLAPFIAPLFFPQSDPLVALILIYFPFGLLARPLGALYFGRLSDRLGSKKVQYYSLMGTSLTLLCTAFLPTYSQVGLLGPFLLHLTRGLTSFFAAAEGPSASLILIENAPENKKNWMSSYYEMSSILGTFIASLLITWLSFHHLVLANWRYLFFFSGFLGLLGFFCSKKIFFNLSLSKETLLSVSLRETLQKLWLPFLAITFLTGFSCSNYFIAMKMFNAYIPLVTSLLPHELLAMHTYLLLLDFLLLPLFGWIAQKVGSTKLIVFSLVLFLILLFFLFKHLEKPTFMNIFALRMIFIGLGTAIAAPFNAWAIKLLPAPYRFRVLALSRAIGAQVLGGISISLSLWLTQKTNLILAPAFYLAFLALLTLFFIQRCEMKKTTEKKVFQKII